MFLQLHDAYFKKKSKIYGYFIFQVMCGGWGEGRVASGLGVAVGAVALTALVTGFVTNVWLYTKEPVSLPNNQPPTTVTFKIGFWRVCPALNKGNYTIREYSFDWLLRNLIILMIIKVFKYDLLSLHGFEVYNGGMGNVRKEFYSSNQQLRI